MGDATEAKIAEINAEIQKTQKNKATEGHLAVLKAKLAKLRREQLQPSSKGGGGSKGRGFDVTKVGHARVGLVGFPSVGKSTLLNKLTDTYSSVAEYAFTTVEAVPGVIRYNGARIQLLDLPGIIEGAKDGKGRGKQVIGAARTCDLMIIVLDAMKPITHKQQIERELEGFGLRLNKSPPDISFKRKDKGGVNYTYSVTDPKRCPDFETVQQICKEYKVPNADVVMKGDYSDEDLIDVIEGNRVYIPCIYAMNKIDNLTLEELEILDSLPHYVPISSEREWNLDGLLEKMWEYLDMIRVYPKPKGEDPDFEEPVVLPRRKRSVGDFIDRGIHKEVLKSLKHALIWGLSAKHSPQRVGKDHQLEDEDVVQVIKK